MSQLVWHNKDSFLHNIGPNFAALSQAMGMSPYQRKILERNVK
jgi:hypothetical protein